MCICLALLNCTQVKMVNVGLCVFYQNKKETNSYMKNSLAAFMALIGDKGLERG